jgi:hypothetical protein
MQTIRVAVVVVNIIIKKFSFINPYLSSISIILTPYKIVSTAHLRLHTDERRLGEIT